MLQPCRHLRVLVNFLLMSSSIVLAPFIVYHTGFKIIVGNKVFCFYMFVFYVSSRAVVLVKIPFQICPNLVLMYSPLSLYPRQILTVLLRLRMCKSRRKIKTHIPLKQLQLNLRCVILFLNLHKINSKKSCTIRLNSY